MTERSCGLCGKTQGEVGEKLKHCAQCCSVSYCSRACQTTHGRTQHKQECATLQQKRQFCMKPTPVSQMDAFPREQEEMLQINANKHMPDARTPAGLKTCMLPSWPHARKGPGRTPPLFPGPPLWCTPALLPGHQAFLVEKKAPLLLLTMPRLLDQLKLDEAYLLSRDYACDHCGKTQAAFRCVCNEAFCSRECQVAEWQCHKRICRTVTDNFPTAPVLHAMYWHRQGVTVEINDMMP